MADMDKSHEANKQRLRQNIISRDEMGEGRKNPSLLVYLVLIFCAAALIYGAYYYMTYTMRSDYTVSWQRDAETRDGDIETFRGYAQFAGGIIKYTKDGAEYIDKNGDVIWERSYQLNAPIIDTSSEYAVIADQSSTAIYIFNSKEITGVSETILPISLVRIADNGVVYAVLNDSEAEYITAFRADGSAIDLSVKSIVSGDGYPFDIDVSPDGTELITSYAVIEAGKVVNNVVFRNFGSVGQNADARRVVGGFKDEFDGHLAGRVHFAANEYSQAFYDGGIVFFSTEVLNTPEILANVSFEEKMLAVAYNDSYSAVLLENSSYASAGNIAANADSSGSSDTASGSGNSSGGNSGTGRSSGGTSGSGGTGSSAGNSSGSGADAGSQDDVNRVVDESEPHDAVGAYRLVIYNNKGVKTGEAIVDIGFKDICFTGDSVVICSSKEINVYSSKGVLRGDLSFEEGEISRVIGSDKNSAFYVMTGNSIMRLEF